MLKRKCVIVTGAGSGVGRATAVALAAVGWDVVLVGRTRAKLEETAALAHSGGELLVLPTDLTDAAAARAVVEQVVRAFGRIDALANIAGSAPMMPIEKVTEADWRACVDSNLSYVIHLTAAAWPVFKKQKSGVIVNTSSMASIDPFRGFSIYAAAKAGVNLFTLCTGQEGEAIGVKAVALALGAVETPMLRGLFDEKLVSKAKTLTPEAVAERVRGYILGVRAFKSGETVVMVK